MIVTREIKDRVEAKLRESIALAESHYGQSFKFPSVIYTKRGRVAGTADIRAWEVNFNATLLMENIEDFIARTVPHEMAHLIDYQLNPSNFEGGWGRKRSVHGPTWKRIMTIIGAENSRCHSYDTTNSRVKKGRQNKHVYVCKTCGKEMKLGAQRHRKMQTGTRYWMRGCGRHAGYNYVGVEGAVRQPLPVAADRPTIVPPANPTNVPTGSKLEKCRALYRDHRGASRQGMIELFMRHADCTKAGAATYYAKIKKEMS